MRLAAAARRRAAGLAWLMIAGAVLAPPAYAQPAPAPTAPTGFPTLPTPQGPPLHILTPPQPVYPAESRVNGEQGRVMLAITVDAQGVPQQVEVVTSSGHARLDAAASTAVAAMRAAPHLIDGAAVPVRVLMAMQFHISPTLLGQTSFQQFSFGAERQPADTALQFVTPPRAPEAAALHAAGLREKSRVRLQMWLSTAGLPSEIRVMQSSGNPRLDEIAVQAMASAVFKPLLLKGKPLRALVLQSMDFAPAETAQAAPEVSARDAGKD